MKGVLQAFVRIWGGILSIFGRKPAVKSEDLAPAHNVSKYLSLVGLIDVTSNTTEFSLHSPELLETLKARHNGEKLNWHLMSGSSVFIPEVSKNVLFERLFYSLEGGRGHRTLVEKSFILMTPWESGWTNPIARSRILQVNETAGRVYEDDFMRTGRPLEGPEDQRALYDPTRKMIYLNFNMLTPLGDRQMFSKSISINGFVNVSTPIVQYEHEGLVRLDMEKNWTPIVINSQLYYIYSLEPLRILKCNGGNKEAKVDHQTTTHDVTDQKEICTVMFEGERVDSSNQTGALRCGTNWMEFKPGIFFSIARTRATHRKCHAAIYRPNIVVMKFEIGEGGSGEYSKPTIIFVSEPITMFDQALFEKYSKKGLSSGSKCDDHSVLTPGSITNWSGLDHGDVMDVTMSVNDEMNIVMQIKGIGRYIELVASDYSKQYEKYLKANISVGKRAEEEMRKFIEKSF